MIEKVQLAIIVLPCLLIGCTIHEFAHALTAKMAGDRTAEMAGRLSLNPIKHIDPIGTLLLPIVSIFLAGIPLLCWAKPVPVNPYNYRKPSWDVWVSLAGPLSNVLLFALIALVLKIVGIAIPIYSLPAGLLIFFFMLLHMNIVMAVFNMLPFPPLDGSHILYHYLIRGKYDWEKKWFSFQSYGFIVLFILIQFPFFQAIMRTLYLTPMNLTRQWIGF